MKQIAIILSLIFFLSACSYIATDKGPDQTYLYYLSDNNMGVYYNVFPTRTEFAIKNISKTPAINLETNITCRVKGGLFSYDYSLGRVKIYYSKKFDAYITFNDCTSVVLEYSFTPEPNPEYKYNNNDKGMRFNPLPRGIKISGEIVIKRI